MIKWLQKHPRSESQSSCAAVKSIDDYSWGMDLLVRVKGQWINVHTLTRFSAIPSLNFRGYMLVRACGKLEVVQVPLDTEAVESECRCPVFADYEA